MFHGLRNFNQLSVSIRVSRVDFHLRANFFFKKTARDVFVDDTHWALCAWMMDEWCLTGGIVQTLWDRWELVSKKRRFSQKWGVPIGNQKPFQKIQLFMKDCGSRRPGTELTGFICGSLVSCCDVVVLTYFLLITLHHVSGVQKFPSTLYTTCFRKPSWWPSFFLQMLTRSPQEDNVKLSVLCGSFCGLGLLFLRQ